MLYKSMLTWSRSHCRLKTFHSGNHRRSKKEATHLPSEYMERHIYQYNRYMWEDKVFHGESCFNKAAAHRHM